MTTATEEKLERKPGDGASMPNYPIWNPTLKPEEADILKDYRENRLDEKFLADPLKLDGKIIKEIDDLASEYVTDFHKIVDSPDPRQRVNVPKEMGDEVSALTKGLEGIIYSNGGKSVRDGMSARKIINRLIERAYELDPLYTRANQKLSGDDRIKLSGDGTDDDTSAKKKARKQEISEYLRKAGVDELQILKEMINTGDVTNIDKLPDNHPLRNLVTYIIHQSYEKQRRKDFIEQKLQSFGDMYGPVVTEAMNKYGGTRLDPRFAKVPEALKAFQLLVQARLAEYEAKDPTKVYNKMGAYKGFENAVGASRN